MGFTQKFIPACVALVLYCGVLYYTRDSEPMTVFGSMLAGAVITGLLIARGAGMFKKY